MGAIEITDANFDEQVTNETNQLVLVDYWAEWCGPCRMLAPVVEGLSEVFAGQVKVGKLDTDANPQSAQKAEIVSIPCLILYKNGQEIDRFVGFKPQDALEADIRAHLA